VLNLAVFHQHVAIAAVTCWHISRTNLDRIDSDLLHTRTSCTVAVDFHHFSIHPFCPSTMSHSSTRRVSFGNKLKGVFSTTSQPSVLAPILDIVVQASSPYDTLQEAAVCLAKVMQQVEVRPRPLSSAVSQWLIFSGQKAAQHKDHAADLRISFSNLAAELQGPLKDPDTCSHALRQRVHKLSR